MPKTYYDSELTGAQIESALEAIDGVVTPSNNGKILRVKDGSIEAVSASEYTSGIEVEPLSVTANDTYTAPAGKAYSPVTVNVSGGGGGGDLPSGGSDGDVLIKSGTGAAWTNTPPQMGSLAYIETTSSVSKQDGYRQGDYLVYNGQLYKVTTTISQGQTLNPGGNIEAVQNGGLNDVVNAYLIPISVNISVPQGVALSIVSNASFQVGKVVIFNIRISASSQISANTIILTGLPKANNSLGVGAYFGAMSNNIASAQMVLINSADGLYTQIRPQQTLGVGAYVISGCYVAV